MVTMKGDDRYRQRRIEKNGHAEDQDLVNTWKNRIVEHELAMAA